MLLLAIQLLEKLDHLVSLRTGTGMILDCLDQTAIGGSGPAIMKKEQALSQTPQGSSAEFIRAGGALGDIVSQAGPHMVDQQIGIERCALIVQPGGERGSPRLQGGRKGKLTSRTGPLAEMKSGMELVAPLSAAAAICGLVLGLVPPVAG
jgi:hypothetical protein